MWEGAAAALQSRCNGGWLRPYASWVERAFVFRIQFVNPSPTTTGAPSRSSDTFWVEAARWKQRGHSSQRKAKSLGLSAQGLHKPFASHACFQSPGDLIDRHIRYVKIVERVR